MARYPRQQLRVEQRICIVRAELSTYSARTARPGVALAGLHVAREPQRVHHAGHAPRSAFGRARELVVEKRDVERCVVYHQLRPPPVSRNSERYRRTSACRSGIRSSIHAPGGRPLAVAPDGRSVKVVAVTAVTSPRRRLQQRGDRSSRSFVRIFGMKQFSTEAQKKPRAQREGPRTTKAKSHNETVCFIEIPASCVLQGQL